MKFLTSINEQIEKIAHFIYLHMSYRELVINLLTFPWERSKQIKDVLRDREELYLAARTGIIVAYRVAIASHSGDEMEFSPSHSLYLEWQEAESMAENKSSTT